MEPDRIWEFVTNPAWRPLTDADGPGFIALGVVAVVLVALTVWTYLGSDRGTPKRIAILIGIRLFALLLAVITALRPSASITEIPKLPSTLLVVIDSSESMTVKDEPNATRWETIRRVISESQSILDSLRDDQQTTIHVYHFHKDFDPERDRYEDGVKPEGKRTDFARMLSRLYEKHQGERLLRGLVIVSDGAHNGDGKPELEIAKWRGIGCPVYSFVVGQTSTVTNQKDIAITSINIDPSPVPIKAEMKVKAKLNAQGFEGVRVRVRLRIDGKEQVVQEFELTKPIDNEIELKTKAPDQPGEIRVALELVDPPSNQVTKLNDSIETYLTVTKDGVRVLVIGKDGWELRQIREALARDRRFDYLEATRSTEAAGTADDAKRFDLREQRYDVIVLGDVSPASLTAARPGIIQEIADLVREKGIGLMMTGGAYSLAGNAGIPGATGWANTPVADILPVQLPPISPPTVRKPIAMEPTDDGLRHYILRLAADGLKNREAWKTLNTGYVQLGGHNEMGDAKPTAVVFARADDREKGRPLLVGQELGKGRVLAFAASDSYRWTQPSLDPNNRRLTGDYHARFWKQMVLWLAHQDEVEGNCYVRPEFRRLVSGAPQTIRLGLRDKRGDEVPDSDLRYQILGPNEQPDKSKAKRADRDPKGGAKATFDTKVTGEFRVVAWGEGKDSGGEAVSGDATARYVVYPEVSDELLQPAARPDFMLMLENTANGTAVDSVRRADRLAKFLEEMKNNPPKSASPRPKPYPDWRRDQQKWFLPLILVLFTAVLGLEWGLRRAWGMV